MCSSFAVVSREEQPEPLINTFVNQDPHQTRAKRSSRDSSRTWTASSRLTVGKPSRKSSRDSPFSRYSNIVFTGDTRASKNWCPVHHFGIARDRFLHASIVAHVRLTGGFAELRAYA